MTLEPRWHPGPGRRYLAEGDTVRVKGIAGRRFKVLGFRDGCAELFALAPATGQRTIPAERLIRANPWPVSR